MTDEQCRLQTVKAQEVVGAGRLVGDLMSRARKDERKGFSERGPTTAEAQSDFTEHMAGSAQLTVGETYYSFGEGTLICSLMNLELFCITGLYNLIFISSLMP